MSISKSLQPFKDSSRLTLNDKFMGDAGANELAHFLVSHRNVESLEIKSNDISSQGFISIFESVLSNPNIKQLNIQHNNLGVNDYLQWHQGLGNILTTCNKLERLNISNNKITSQGFSRLIYPIVYARNLKLLQIRYNSISNQQIEELTNQLIKSNNSVLLYVEVVGNKVQKSTIDNLEAFLSKNRQTNPTTKQKLMNNVGYRDQNPQNQFANGRRTLSNFNTLDQIPRDGIVQYLQDILNQTRLDSAQTKVKLEQQLSDLQKKQKLDGIELNGFDKKCNEMIIINRNLKFQLDRTLGQYEQLQKDSQLHLRSHQQKVREGSRELQGLQKKYEDMEDRMNKEHEIKMKQIVRDWQARLRSVEQKIRGAQNDNSILQNEIRKHLEKRERLKIENIEAESFIRNNIDGEQGQRYRFKLQALESKLRQICEARDGYIARNQELVYEIQNTQAENRRQIDELEMELTDLREKEGQFNAKSKDFFTKNEKVKADVQMRQISIDKLEEEIKRLDKEIQSKRNHEEEELLKVRQNFQYSKQTRAEDRKSQLAKLSQLQNNLRSSQLEGSKLRQEYGLLAQKLQVGISLAVHKVFEENSLY